MFQDGDSASERHVAAAAEEGHTREAQDGGHQGGVGDATQAFDAALKATCRGTEGQELSQAVCDHLCHHHKSPQGDPNTPENTVSIVCTGYPL